MSRTIKWYRTVRMWSLVLSLFVFALLLAACFGSADQPKNETSATPTIGIVATRLLRIDHGFIVYKDGCLFLQTEDGGRLTLVWWPQLKPIVHEEDGTVEIIEPGAEPIVIRLNDQLVQFGGGPSSAPQGPEFDVVDENAGIDRCPGPYYLPGSVKVLQ